tara:strand:- start:74 stop:448 length:375 start_codon:yes stop_codon:yes gene_type:complete
VQSIGLYVAFLKEKEKNPNSKPLARDLIQYIGKINAGTSALPFMKSTYSPTLLSPLVWLPPEMLERVYLYCTQGRLSIQEMRGLYAAGVLLGIEGMTDRQIVYHAVVEGMQVLLEPSEKCATEE